MCEACGFPSPFVHLRVVLIFFGCRTPQGALSPGGDPPQGKNTSGIPNFTFVSLRIRTLRGISQSPSFTGEKNGDSETLRVVQSTQVVRDRPWMRMHEFLAPCFQPLSCHPTPHHTGSRLDTRSQIIGGTCLQGVREGHLQSGARVGIHVPSVGG